MKFLKKFNVNGRDIKSQSELDRIHLGQDAINELVEKEFIKKGVVKQNKKLEVSEDKG